MTIEERLAELEARLTKVEKALAKPVQGTTLCSARTRSGKLCRSRAHDGGDLCAIHAAEAATPSHKAEADRENTRKLSRALGAWALR